MAGAERTSGWRVGVVALAGVAVAGCGSSVVPLDTRRPTSLPSPTPAVIASPAGPSPLASTTATVQPTTLATPTPATPTATPPTPTPTVLPSPTGATLGLTISETDIGAHLDALAEIADRNGGIRAAGTPGYDASADYVAEQLAALGFEVTRQPVEFTFFDEAAPVTLTVGQTTWTGGEWLHSMLYGGEGDVSGTFEIVGAADTGDSACTRGEWDGFRAGRVALVLGSGCIHRDKVALAEDARAAAVIAPYLDWEADQTKRPTLIEPSAFTIPAIVAGREPAEALLAAPAGTTVELEVDTERRRVTVDNVIAELPGTTDELVMLGAHLDSVLDGPGINDNGSGVATLLALAQAVAGQPVPDATIRFGFWAAEEFGEFGSTRYVDSLRATDLDRMRVYLNLDMVASPDGERIVYDSDIAAPGSSGVTQSLLAALDELGAPGFPADIGGGSDHAQFDRVGVVTGGLFSGIDACYHLACDDRQNVDLEMALAMGGAVAAVLEELAYEAATD